jgi:hypothetical protein
MRKILLGLMAASSLATPLALAASASADAGSPAPGCVPVKAAPAWTETQYKYKPVANGSGSTYWSAKNDAKTTVNGVDYANAGSVRHIDHPAVEGVTCTVTLPQFEATNLCTPAASATVPLTPHVKTYLYGVQGHPETDAITEPVTVTPDMVGGQFWIGYQPDAGYVATNTGQWHIDFNAPCPAA